MGCKDLLKLGKSIKSARTVTVYTIAKNPTIPEAQDSLKNYVMDYEITDSLAINKEKIKELKAAFSNTENYDTINTKRCPFIGKYAILFDDKVTAIISTPDCAKIKATLKESDTLYAYDLTNENTISKILSELETK